MSSQQVRQPVRRLIQLPVRPRTLPAHQRHRLRSAGHLRGEQHRNRHRASPARSTPPGYPTSSSPACSPASSTSIDDNRRAGSAVIATNTRCNRSAKSETSKFENGCPAPAVLRKSSSPAPEKITQSHPPGRHWSYVAVAATPAKSRVKPTGGNLRYPICRCPGPRGWPSRSRACTGNR